MESIRYLQTEITKNNFDQCYDIINSMDISQLNSQEIRIFMSLVIRYLSINLSKEDYQYCKKIITYIPISILSRKEKSSYYSLIMRYYYHTDNVKEMTKIIYSDIKLMKRDYLLYCKTIYKSHTSVAIGIFKEHIISNEQLLTSDIDFLIDNNMYKIIKSMNGYYINCSKISNKINYMLLKRYPITKNKDMLIEHFKKSIPSESYQYFIKKLKDRDVIIDGGNVIHYTMPKSFSNIEKILRTSLKNYHNPLIIIHQRHFKTSESKEFYEKYSKYIFKTPYNVYDDIFIILGMIINDIPIITNDLFRDHIFEAFKLFESKNNQIANYINEMKLSFSVSKYNTKIENMVSYSKCIQFNTNHIYVPTCDGFHIINI